MSTGWRPAAKADPAAIERSINETRERLEDTLDALQTRLSPQRLVDLGLDYLKRNGGEMAGNLGRRVRQNPLALLLAGTGLVWLMSASDQQAAQSGQTLGAAASGAYDGARRLGASTADAARGVRDAAAATGERLADAAHAAADRTRRAGAGLSQAAQEQPLLLGVMALAAGALLGATLPATQTEDRLIGEARDASVARVRRAASEGLAQARARASEALQDKPSAVAPPSAAEELGSQRTH